MHPRSPCGLLPLLSIASAEPPREAPPPDRASGIEVPEDVPLRSRLLRFPRALLFVPRWIVWGVGQPIRGAAYAYERYELRSRAVDVMFDNTRTYGVFPVATYESGFGVTGGARFLHRDLAGARERLKLRVDFGGRYRQAYGANLRTGERFGRLVVELDTSYERRPNERFFGVGNADVSPHPLVPTAPTDVAVSTRFRENVQRNMLRARMRLVPRLYAQSSVATMHRSFASTGEADSLERVYVVDDWMSGTSNLYAEQALVYDSRRPTSYRSRAFDAAGWLASAHVGIARGLGTDRSNYVAYGGELQRYFDLYDGSRVLVSRLLVEAIDGDASFVDLPRLGGTEHLRGYPNGRFRDRAVTLGTVEYAWDLGNFLAAYTFVDVGRAWESLAALEAPRSLRVGFGGGIQIHTDESFLVRLQIAGSRDGDKLLELSLSPAHERRERAGRF